MLRKTLFILRNNISFFLMFLILFTAMALFQSMNPESNTSSGFSIVPVFFCYYIGRLVVQDLKTVPNNAKGLGPFILKSFCLIMLSFILSLFVVVILMADSSGGNRIAVWHVGLLLLCYLVFMSLLGTWPFSSLGATGGSLLAALRRGIRRFPSTFGRGALATLLPLLIAFPLIKSTDDISASAAMFSDWPLTAGVIAVNFVAAAVNTLGFAYFAVVLAQVYVDSEKDAAIPAMAGTDVEPS